MLGRSGVVCSCSDRRFSTFYAFARFWVLGVSCSKLSGSADLGGFVRRGKHQLSQREIFERAHRKRRNAALRTEMREIAAPDGSVRRVRVKICPVGYAEGSEREPARRKAPKRGRGHQRRWRSV